MKLAVLNEHVFHFVTFQEYLLSRGEDPRDWTVAIYYDSARPDLLDLYETYLSEANWVSYRFFPYRKFSGRLKVLDKVRCALAMVTYVTLGKRQLTLDTLLLGNYGSSIAKVLTKILRVRGTTVIDEGNGTQAIAERRRLAGASVSGAYTFFTRYSDLSFGVNDRVIPCTYDHILGDRVSSEVDTGKVLFLGNPFSEAGLMDWPVYLAYVRAVNDHYVSQNISMHYKPHRSETAANLGMLTDCGIHIVTDKWPIEIHLMKLGYTPLHVSSFFTSAFATISAIYHNRVALVAYRLEEKDLLNRAKWCTEQYDYYTKNAEALNIVVRSVDGLSGDRT